MGFINIPIAAISTYLTHIISYNNGFLLKNVTISIFRSPASRFSTTIFFLFFLSLFFLFIQFRTSESVTTQHSKNTGPVNTTKHAQLPVCQDPHAVLLRSAPQQLVFSLYNGRVLSISNAGVCICS